jgi:hypothetical protein
LTVVHYIDENSPLNDLTKFKNGEIVCFLEGTDSTTANSVQYEIFYNSTDICIDHDIPIPIMIWYSMPILQMCVGMYTVAKSKWISTNFMKL